jgi:hypothetical protein
MILEIASAIKLPRNDSFIFVFLRHASCNFFANLLYYNKRNIQSLRRKPMSTSPSPKEPNTLGNASLVLGIISTALVFGIGLCALTGIAQNWIRLVGTPLFICGGSSAFLGFLGAILGLAGLFGRDRSRATAIIGLLLSFSGICLFLVVLSNVGG